jgi:hypothetical protein
MSSMSRMLLLSLASVALFNLPSMTAAQEAKAPGESQKWGGGELDRQMRERQTKIHQLSPEEQAALKAAHEQAAADPAVRTAMANRDRAIQELQITLRATMLKSDPAIASIFKKMMTGQSPRPNRVR